MSEITFNANLREKAGKGAARACRREGRIPAVIYGGKKNAVKTSSLTRYPICLFTLILCATKAQGTQNVFSGRIGQSW